MQSILQITQITNTIYFLTIWITSSKLRFFFCCKCKLSVDDSQIPLSILASTIQHPKAILNYSLTKEIGYELENEKRKGGKQKWDRDSYIWMWKNKMNAKLLLTYVPICATIEIERWETEWEDEAYQVDDDDRDLSEREREDGKGEGEEDEAVLCCLWREKREARLRGEVSDYEREDSEDHTRFTKMLSSLTSFARTTDVLLAH